jgi:hypothetical protein
MQYDRDLYQQPPVQEVASAKKPRMSLKAKKQAFADLSSLITYRTMHDENYEMSDGLGRLMESLGLDIKTSEGKKE